MQIFADKKFENPVDVIKAFDNESFKEAFDKIEEYKNKYYLLGYIRYDAKEIFLGNQIKSKSPLLYFEVFENYSEFKPNSNPQKSFLKPVPKIKKDSYIRAINLIKKEIEAGNTYEVNYTYDNTVYTNLGGFDLYESILPNQTTPYNAYIKNKWDELLSYSPELFFEIENNQIKTKPMKGTVKRGFTKEKDSENIEFLKNDEKNRSENIMIVDLLRNDLGKIAKAGTVNVDKLFDVETHKTVHQMTSEISAELEEGTTLYKIFEAIFPCGSITGAPKINTMKIIDELEFGKREVYCGAIGLISPKKTVFSVPIRLLQRKSKDNYFTCRVGGAIVWDSDAIDEWKETITKIKFLETDLPKEIQLVETIKIQNLKLLYKKGHFNRLKNSAKELGFKFNYDILKIPDQKQDGMLRILLSKDGTFVTQYASLKEAATNKVIISPFKINGKEPLLKHKTTYRPWYEDSFIKMRNGEIYDEIFFNENGELTEGARSNVIIEKDGEFFTPPVECGLLNGIFRQKLLKDGLKEFNTDKKLIEKKIYLEDLKSADKIYCVNSVRGIKNVEVDCN